MPTVCSPHFLLAPTHPWPYIQEMTTFTGTGVSAASTVTVVGSTTVTLTNTSSFIGTVFIEGSPDGGKTWQLANTPLTAGTMVAGPLTFDIPTPVTSMQIRLHCTAYTSGTLTYAFAPQVVPVFTTFGGNPQPSLVSILGISAGGGGNPCTITSGLGAPSAIQPNGSLYMRQDGSTNTRLYISNGSTWVAVSSS